MRPEALLGHFPVRSWWASAQDRISPMYRMGRWGMEIPILTREAAVLQPRSGEILLAGGVSARSALQQPFGIASAVPSRIVGNVQPSRDSRFPNSKHLPVRAFDSARDLGGHPPPGCLVVAVRIDAKWPTGGQSVYGLVHRHSGRNICGAAPFRGSYRADGPAAVGAMALGFRSNPRPVPAAYDSRTCRIR